MKLQLLNIFIITTLFIGCEDVLEPQPIGVSVVDNVYVDEAGAIAGINAAYQPLNGLYNTTLQVLVDLASDDAYTWRTETQHSEFTADYSDPRVSQFWSGSYQGINNCNVVLNRVPDMTFASDPELKDIIIGQAYFLRAFYYFNLVRLFGELPLLLEETKSVDEATKERSSIEEVYEQIIIDLETAAGLLPNRGVYSGGVGREQGRATLGAANALLAAVHLTLENWDQAANASEKVIESGSYDLFLNYSDNFYGANENGTESVFEVQYGNAGSPTSSLNTFFAHPSLVNGNGAYAHVPTSNAINTGFPGAPGGGIGIVEDFETGDFRKDVSISYYDFTVGVVLGTGPPDPLINKYFMGDALPAGVSPANYPVIRYAEVLLIRAESLNELGAANSEAISIINEQIRERAGLGPLSQTITDDQAAFREAIWKERRTEMAFESKRLFDLNRTGRTAERLAAQGITINPAKIGEHPVTGKEQYLYPIPFSEISTNPLVQQNPGY